MAAGPWRERTIRQSDRSRFQPGAFHPLNVCKGPEKIEVAAGGREFTNYFVGKTSRVAWDDMQATLGTEVAHNLGGPYQPRMRTAPLARRTTSCSARSSPAQHGSGPLLARKSPILRGLGGSMRNLWGSLRGRCGCLVVIRGTDPTIAMTEGVFKSIVRARLFALRGRAANQASTAESLLEVGLVQNWGCQWLRDIFAPVLGPGVIVTDKLRSYGVAQRHLLPDVEHRPSRYLNNRAENSHRPTRRRERQMQRFKSPEQAHDFLSAHAFIHGHFHPRRHLMPAAVYRAIRSTAFNVWQQETGARHPA